MACKDDYECNNSDCGSSGNNGGSSDSVVCVSSVSVSPSYVNLSVGEWYYDAVAQVSPWNATDPSIIWRSDNDAIASVNPSNGYIYAEATGSVRIYATATDGSDCSDYLIVTVSSTVPVTSVSLDRKNLSLEEGQETTLNATVCPYNATEQGLYWNSSNKSVAKVSNGVVTAVSKGSAVITATAIDGSGESASCVVSVTGDILVTTITISPSTSTMAVGDSAFLNATICPANATNQSLYWSSSNTNVATVNEITGLVMAQHAGTATIYATACDNSGAVASCEVHVQATTTVCPESNDTFMTAQEIDIETPVSGCICCPGTEQWFKFTAPQSATYTIYTTGSLNTVGTLYDCCGNFITEIDDYEPCGKKNFRIIQDLDAGATYYVQVTEASSNTGSFYLKVTQKRLVDSISINPSEITLEHIGKVYELPLLPNTFTGVEGAEPLTTLVASTIPSSADEKKVLWYSFDKNVIKIDTGWYNGQKYQTLTVVGAGTAKLYAQDWNENGKRDECTIEVRCWPVYAKPTIHSRDEWEAKDAVTNRLVKRERQPERIIFHHPAKQFSSTNISDIKKEIKRIQNRHIAAWDRDPKSDIAYHFLIDPAGGIWQGAEIDEYKRGHAEGYFDDIGVSILGNFEPEKENNYSPNILNDYQKNAMEELSKWLCYEYDLKFDTTDGISPITTHRSVVSGTVCPGANAAPWIENDLRNYIIEWYYS